MTLWTWDYCPGEVPDRARVESAHIYEVGSVPGVDDSGALVIMPTYSAWDPVLIQESAAQTAEVPCEPARGELCAVIVTSLDNAGNQDKGESCE